MSSSAAANQWWVKRWMKSRSAIRCVLNEGEGPRFLPDSSDGDFEPWGQILGYKLTVAAFVVISQVFSRQAGLCNNITMSFRPSHLHHTELRQVHIRAPIALKAPQCRALSYPIKFSLTIFLCWNQCPLWLNTSLFKKIWEQLEY